VITVFYYAGSEDGEEEGQILKMDRNALGQLIIEQLIAGWHLRREALFFVLEERANDESSAAYEWQAWQAIP